MLGKTVAEYFGVEFKTVSNIKSHLGLKVSVLSFLFSCELLNNLTLDEQRLHRGHK
jgi:hypothetical protein